MAIINVGDSQAFGYTGGVQAFTAPASGVYHLEAYGAAGGGFSSSFLNYGGYASGYVKLQKGDVLYVCCGGQGAGTDGLVWNAVAAGGYNGGGAGGYNREWSDDIENFQFGHGCGGGGATHIATVTGTLAQIGAAGKAHVLLVAGGAGGRHADYNGSWSPGCGGGETGTGTNPGTQAGGYAFGQGGPGVCSNSAWYLRAAAGGGGGLYGGHGSDDMHDGSGGSGYTGGVPAFAYKNASYAPSMTTGHSGAGGSGRAVITFVAKGELPVIMNGTALEAIWYNGVEVTSLIYNGVKLFFERLKNGRCAHDLACCCH